MSGKCAVDNFDDRRFRFAIGFGHQIDRVRLAIDSYSAEPFEMNSAGSTRGAERNLFNFVDHGKRKSITRQQRRPARRADQSTMRDSSLCFERIQDGSRTLNRARKKSRAVYGPSPSSSPLQGEGKKGYQRGVSDRPMPSATLPSSSRARALDSG